MYQVQNVYHQFMSFTIVVVGGHKKCVIRVSLFMY